MKIIFSDLDGTLLQQGSYSYEAAGPALSAIRQQNVPLIFCTSKTRAEVEMWRNTLGNNDPFIVENGGAVYIPRKYFPFPIERAVRRKEYDVVEFGAPYLDLVRTLHRAVCESGCEALGFFDMTVAEIARRTSLPIEQAALAKIREYDEPFEIIGSGTHALLSAIEKQGKRWTRGNRLYHVMGGSDKSVAVDYLTRLYRKAFGEVQTIGVGDGHNDVRFLSTVDTPIVIRSDFAVTLKRAVPGSQVTDAPGPDGWNEAILPLVGRPSVLRAAP